MVPDGATRQMPDEPAVFFPGVTLPDRCGVQYGNRERGAGDGPASALPETVSTEKR